MARKGTPMAAPARGGSDILGIVLVSLSILLGIALFTFDKSDLAINRVPPNFPTQNWIGKFGASSSYALFFAFGAAAYLLPVLVLGFGLAQFVDSLSYLRRRWPWAFLLVFVCAAAFDLGTDEAALELLAKRPGLGSAGFFEQLSFNLNVNSAGGVLGASLNRYIFGYFGHVGSVIVFVTLWVIGLYGLTNFRLGEWLRSVLRRPEPIDLRLTDEEALERRASELEREARRLQQELEKTIGETEERSGNETEQPAVGPDLRPVPEPTVRDLSVPQLKRTIEEGSSKVGEADSKGVDESTADIDEVIPAKEVAASAEQAQISKAPEPQKVPAAASAESAAQKSEETEPSSVRASLPDAASIAGRVRPAVRPTKPISVAAPPKIGNYQLPPLDLLNLPEPTVRPTESKEELMANARLMQQTLAQFEIPVSLGDITKGPTITRYELHPAPGVKLERITALANNIAAALKAERINILAPVPGKSSVGVEVPNLVKSKVIIRELLESEEWRKTKARIPLAIGKDVYGNPIVADLSEMPHLLIAGSTGSGKSVCLNALITSLLYRFPPDQLRFVMIDPKVVELQQYNSLPHLVVPVVTDPKKVILALRWVISEMEKRYQIFARVGVRNIWAFNERPKNKPLPPREPELPLTTRKERIEPSADGFAVQVDEDIVAPEEEDIIIPDKLSYIVVIIDELADLMLVAPADVEMAIARITQMARAAGIHCIVATQRPSVDVVTGIIKANIPCRIAFQVASKVDSRTILDAMGADKLLGKGDMLYLPPGSAKLIRAQGALVTDAEITRIVEFISKQGKPNYEVEIHQQLSRANNGFDFDEGIDEDEELIQQCIEVIRSEKKASVSLLQRRLRLGYTRAARIMDELEKRGIVGPSKGAEPRDILIDLDGTGADGRPVQDRP